MFLLCCHGANKIDTQHVIEAYIYLIFGDMGMVVLYTVAWQKFDDALGQLLTPPPPSPPIVVFEY